MPVASNNDVLGLDPSSSECTRRRKGTCTAKGDNLLVWPDPEQAPKGTSEPARAVTDEDDCPRFSASEVFFAGKQYDDTYVYFLSKTVPSWHLEACNYSLAGLSGGAKIDFLAELFCSRLKALIVHKIECEQIE